MTREEFLSRMERETKKLYRNLERHEAALKKEENNRKELRRRLTNLKKRRLYRTGVLLEKHLPDLAAWEDDEQLKAVVSEIFSLEESRKIREKLSPKAR